MKKLTRQNIVDTLMSDEFKRLVELNELVFHHDTDDTIQIIYRGGYERIVLTTPINEYKHEMEWKS